ncbi:CBU_0592 family membrane protein [Kallotenue papyrolyticum]|uniref:CBU_0592 family membrane protein n=1 Tax=Kallotenue papyrolyticum TaxID=1325125 RepID=UPI0004785FA3|nr:hypothetical protein [Kallotenue papyrolyticum]
MTLELLIDVLGWLGAAALLLAYALVSTRRLAGDAPAYQGLNMLGGVLLIINSAYHGAYPSVGVNIIWIVIAVLTLARRTARARP